MAGLVRWGVRFGALGVVMLVLRMQWLAVHERTEYCENPLVIVQRDESAYGEFASSTFLATLNGYRRTLLPPPYNTITEWNPDTGWLMYHDGYDGNLWRMRLIGDSREPVTQLNDIYQTLVLGRSVDNEWLYTVVWSDRQGTMLYRTDRNGTQQPILWKAAYAANHDWSTARFGDQFVVEVYESQDHFVSSSQIYLIDLEEGTAYEQPFPKFLGWSPDGEWLLFWDTHQYSDDRSKGYLYRVRPTTGYYELLMAVDLGVCPSCSEPSVWGWSANQRWLIFKVLWSLYRINWNTGGITQLADKSNMWGTSIVTWMPDQERLIYSKTWIHSTSKDTMLLNVRTGEQQPLYEEHIQVGTPSTTRIEPHTYFVEWTPDQSAFVLHTNDGLYLMSATDASIIRPIDTHGLQGSFDTWSPCGDDWFALTTSNGLYRINMDGSGVTQFTNSPYDYIVTWVELPNHDWHPLPLAIYGLLITVASFICRRR